MEETVQLHWNTEEQNFRRGKLTLGSYLDDVDTLESSDSARSLLVSIVAQTQLPIAIVAPTIDLQEESAVETGFWITGHLVKLYA